MGKKKISKVNKLPLRNQIMLFSNHGHIECRNIIKAFIPMLTYKDDFYVPIICSC